MKASETTANDALADKLHGEWSEIVKRHGVHNGLYDVFTKALTYIRSPTQDAAPAPVLTEEDEAYLKQIRECTTDHTHKLNYCLGLIDRLTKQAPQPEEKV